MILAVLHIPAHAYGRFHAIERKLEVAFNSRPLREITQADIDACLAHIHGLRNAMV